MCPAKSEVVKNVDNVKKTSLAILYLIGYGYLVVAVFLTIFVLSLAKGTRLNATLGAPKWALLIAISIVLPLLLPAVKYVAPYVKSVKISDFELSFTQAEVGAFSLASLADKLRTAAEQVSAPEYASMMTSFSSVIVDAIRDVQSTKDEVLVVDLREGKAWIPPNLYFLTSLAADRTAVRQIAFVETRHVEGSFVGMCYPDELKEALETKFPDLQKAGEQSQYRELPLNLAGTAYFKGLHDLYAASAPAISPRDTQLSGSNLFAITGSHIHRQKIEAKAVLSEEDYRRILCSDYPYTAVVNDEELQSLISRDKVAVLVARDLIGKSAS